MHPSSTKATILTILVLVAAASVAAAAGTDQRIPAGRLGAVQPVDVFAQLRQDDIVVPEEWEGVWQFTWSVYDCDTDLLLFSDTSQDTICAGDDAIEPGDDVDLNCTGSVDENTIHLECNGSMEIMPGCTANFGYVYDATLDADSFEATLVVTTDYVGDCPVEDSCMRQEISGTRIAPAPDDCGSAPISTTTWGALKEMYR